MSCVLKKTCAPDQCLCFLYIESTVDPLPKPLSIFCGCTAQFVSDLVGNPEDKFSGDEAPIRPYFFLILGLQIFFQNIKVRGGKKIKIKITKKIIFF